MTTHKTLDIEPEISTLLAKIEKKRTDHLIKLGEIVLESGIHKLLDGDQLRDLLLRARDQLPRPQTREDKRDAASSTFPAKPAAAAKPNGHAEPEPGRHRAADLLAGTAPT